MSAIDPDTRSALIEKLVEFQKEGFVSQDLNEQAGSILHFVHKSLGMVPTIFGYTMNNIVIRDQNSNNWTFAPGKEGKESVIFKKIRDDVVTILRNNATEFLREHKNAANVLDLLFQKYKFMMIDSIHR